MNYTPTHINIDRTRLGLKITCQCVLEETELIYTAPKYNEYLTTSLS